MRCVALLILIFIHIKLILVVDFTETHSPVGAETTTVVDEKASGLGNKALQEEDQV